MSRRLTIRRSAEDSDWYYLARASDGVSPFPRRCEGSWSEWLAVADTIVFGGHIRRKRLRFAQLDRWGWWAVGGGKCDVDAAIRPILITHRDAMRLRAEIVAEAARRGAP